MTQRERVLARVVVGVVLLGGAAFLFNQLFFQPLQARETAIATATNELANKRQELKRAVADRARLETYRQLSLPPDRFLAGREYQEYLRTLFVDNGFSPESVTVSANKETERTVPGIRSVKKAPFTTLIYMVEAHGKLGDLVKALTEFYQTGLLHRISLLDIRRPLTAAQPGQTGQTGILDIRLRVEALIVEGATPRDQLLPNLDNRFVAVETVLAMRGLPAGGLMLAAWAAGPAGPLGPGVLANNPVRKYSAITEKDIFFGKPPPPPRNRDNFVQARYIYLTSLTWGRRGWEARLGDRSVSKEDRYVFRDEPGFRKVRIRDGKGDIMFDGELVRMDPPHREIVFRSSGSYYRMHVGQSLQDAMRRSITKRDAEGKEGKQVPVSTGASARR